jgi:hypothetical protein
MEKQEPDLSRHSRRNGKPMGERMKYLILLLLLTACTGEQGPAGPEGRMAPSSIEIITGPIVDGLATVEIPDADANPLLVYVYLPVDDAWIQANAYAEDDQDRPFLFEFALIYPNKVEIYSGAGSRYKIYILH